MRSKLERAAAAFLAAALMTGCGAAGGTQSAAVSAAESHSAESAAAEALGGETWNIEDEAVALAESPSAVPLSITPKAPGTWYRRPIRRSLIIPTLRTDILWPSIPRRPRGRNWKAQVTGPSGVTYTYDLTPGKWAVFSLSDGSGSYKATVFQNVSGSKYATVTSVTFTVSLENEFAPFLLPNQYVDYSDAAKTVAKAKQLTRAATGDAGSGAGGV